MRKWLYDPKNDFKGEIFEGEADIAQAKDAGWLEAPYSDMNVVEIPPQSEIVIEKPKPGRKPNATKAGKVPKSRVK